MFALFFLTFVCLVFNQFAIAQTETREKRITIVLKDFYVHPNTTQAKTGRLTLEAVNEGMSIHELVILKIPRHFHEKKPSPSRVLSQSIL
ncbi:MAG: hypothetical protein E4H32_03320 [Nitrospirales bacterium]|nr:MAG: hypothetical protein E4H32_03320 [Nitrospirales bacterium]